MRPVLLVHVFVYALVYAILLLLMPRMERTLLLEARQQLQVYEAAQNFRDLYENVLKASLLATLWPFLSCAPSVVFVGLGCFSMSCFAVACRTDAARTIYAANKLYWHRVAQLHRLRTPTLYGVCDEHGVLRLYDADSKAGVRKPLRGMYGCGVYRDTLASFTRTCQPNELFQEEICDERGMACCYRVCTLNTGRRCRTVSIFCFSPKTSSIPSGLWFDLCAYGKRLAALHAEQLPWAPLVGWDIMCDRRGPVLLEGNLGGLFGGCDPTKWVNCDAARHWREEVRRSFHSDYYAERLEAAEKAGRLLDSRRANQRSRGTSPSVRPAPMPPIKSQTCRGAALKA